jgi:hypothetical protein
MIYLLPMRKTEDLSGSCRRIQSHIWDPVLLKIIFVCYLGFTQVIPT